MDNVLRMPETVWNANFIKIIVSNFLVSSALYMFYPGTSYVMVRTGGDHALDEGFSGVLFVLGAVLLAPFCNYCLDTYRRKTVVMWSLLCMSVCTALFFMPVSSMVFFLLRGLQGAACGVFQIALGSTLLLDLSLSKNRTRAAHIYYWIIRLSLAMGPLMAAVAVECAEINQLVFIPLVMFLLAFVLLQSLQVPFRAPLEPSLCSLDRFWLLRGSRLFVPLCGVAFSVGLFLARNWHFELYVFLLVGFLLALGLHCCCFGRLYNLEIFTGLTLLFVAFGLLQVLPDISVWVTGVLTGAGLGLFSSRYLLAYIRVCEHCERGTAQTSYWLGWESGLAAGGFVGVMMYSFSPHVTSALALLVIIIVFFIHLFYIRGWYEVRKRK